MCPKGISLLGNACEQRTDYIRVSSALEIFERGVSKNGSYGVA